VIAVRTVSATECNRHFSKILRDVCAGETVIVTLRGKPVAEIRSANRTVADREAAKQALFTRLCSQPVLNLPRIRRDELYDD
jgi:prevent-host-death family protein